MSTKSTARELWDKGQRGVPPRYPLAQFPNAPLLVAIGGWLVAMSTDGSAHSYARATFYAGLTAWAWEELADGVNGARRVLGAVGLVYVVVKVGRALGA
jgi:hypothetical protein